jgi:type II secretory ATPase GspE/PulE/Tfp pilus assembly ATPase PilB-like protein
MGKTNIDRDEEMGMVGASPEQVKESRKELAGESLSSNNQQDGNNMEKANNLGLVFVDLTDYQITPSTLNIIPVDIAESLRAISYLNIGSKVRIATDDLDNINEIQTRLETFLADKELKPQLVATSKKSIDQALEQYQTKNEKEEKGKEKRKKTNKKPQTQTTDKKFDNKKTSNIDQSSLKEIESRLGQVPTTELFNTILEEAVKNRASDIHINPQESGARLRFRIDGVLQNVAVLSQTDYQKILSRVKYHGKIKLNVTQKPQDGRFDMEVIGKNIDIRLSSFPSIYGESIVMRLLEEEKEFYSLEELGFSKDTLEKIKGAISKPYGMILNTGPTGSGKTTTLYAILDDLNRPEVKIITLEDPVEYQLSGITQTQIDPEHNFPFKSGLKYALRQDPDIIMVGEIRDKETAATALHSSLTGHLLLSTFHTNNAASTFIRLLDMGLKPFLLIGSVNIVIAQRLVRKLCSNCKQEQKPTENQIKTIQKMAEDDNLEVKKIYTAKGCSKCNNTGFSGRTAIGEVIVPDKELERVILNQPTESQIKELAQKEGMVTISQNGVKKVLEGVTTLEELMRVVA